MDARDRQLLSSTPVTDRTVSLIQRSVDVDFVPPLRMPHVGEAEVVLLGPEKWNGVKSFALAYDVARSGLPLTFGDDKVLDPDALAGEPVWPARDIASGKDARGARLKVLVNGDTVRGQPSPRCKCGLRPHSDADDDEIGLEVVSILQRDALPARSFRRRRRCVCE